MKNSFFGHPAGLSTLFFTEMWERFSYYGMRAILILFMTTPAAKEGMGMVNAQASAVYGLYTAGVYLLTLPGGWLADNIFGRRRAIMYGGVSIMIGHILLAVPGINSIFFLGLCFVAVGTGLLKPNISAIVGDLYPEGGARRDSGFSIFYMGINLGSFFGQLAVAFVAEKYNWHWGFGLAAIGMFFGLIQFQLTQSSLGELGLAPKPKEKSDLPIDNSNRNLSLVLAAALLAFLTILQLTHVIDIFTAQGLAKAMGVVIVTVTLFYFLFILVAGKLDPMERRRVYVIFFLFVGAALFWAGFEQAGSSLNLFARDYTNRTFFGWVMPAGWFQSVNSSVIIVFAPIVGAVWVKLASRNLNPKTPIKFGIGLILMALGFLVMYFAAKLAVTDGKVSSIWLICAYFLHSIGELTLSPVGMSTTTKLAPKRFLGQLMGIWFVGASLGNLIAGLFASGIEPSNATQLPGLFWSVVMFGGIAGLFFLLFSPVLRKWMGDVE